jgi:hypothetical protein
MKNIVIDAVIDGFFIVAIITTAWQRELSALIYVLIARAFWRIGEIKK